MVFDVLAALSASCAVPGDVGGVVILDFFVSVFVGVGECGSAVGWLSLFHGFTYADAYATACSASVCSGSRTGTFRSPSFMTRETSVQPQIIVSDPCWMSWLAAFVRSFFPFSWFPVFMWV